MTKKIFQIIGLTMIGLLPVGIGLAIFVNNINKKTTQPKPVAPISQTIKETDSKAIEVQSKAEEKPTSIEPVTNPNTPSVTPPKSTPAQSSPVSEKTADDDWEKITPGNSVDPNTAEG